MVRQALIFTLPLLLSSCLPKTTEAGVDSKSASEERLKIESDRITRLETELHEMRLLFTNQIQRIEQVAASADNRPIAPAAPVQSQPQQVVIMPQTPVVTHRWDQSEAGTPPYQEAARPTPTRSYQIQPGDTLSEIAVRFQVPLARLLSANSGIDPLRIRPGQSIALPGTTPSQATHTARADSGGYRVQPGDTLSEIASHYGVSLQSLLDSNPGVQPERLRIGKSLVIPSSRPVAQRTAATATRFSSPLDGPSFPDTIPASRPSPERVPLPLPSSTSMASGERTPSKKVLVRVPYNRSLGEIAAECNTDVATLNRLNNSLLSAESRVKANSTIFVPVYEDESI